MTESEELQQLRDEIRLSWEMLSLYGVTDKSIREYKSIPNAIGILVARINSKTEDLSAAAMNAIRSAEATRERWRSEHERIDPNRGAHSAGESHGQK